MDKSYYVGIFTETYSNIPERSKKKADELIRRLAENQLILDECQTHLAEEGAVTSMSQGSYSIMRENPWSKVADSKTKNMLSIIDKLDKMVPDVKTESLSEAGESLKMFVTKGKPKVELG